MRNEINLSMAEKCVHVKEIPFFEFFEYCDVIISVGRNQIFYKALRALLDFSKQRPKLSPHNI